MKHKQMMIRCPQDLAERIRQIAFDLRMSQNALITHLIEVGLRREEEREGRP